MEKFNRYQLERISEITGNLGLLFFGAIVLPTLTGTRELEPPPIITGLVLMGLSWFISISILKKGGKK